MAGGEDEDKQYEASQKKLDDARKKGEVPRSTDLTTAAAYAGFILAAGVLGQRIFLTLGDVLAGFLARADVASTLLFSGSGRPFAGGALIAVLWAAAPLFLLPATFALLAVIAQRAFVVTPDKLMPKLSRISVLSNAKNKFGRAGLFEFAKSFVKLSVYGLVLGGYLTSRTPPIIASLALDPGLVTVLLLRLCLEFLLIVLAISGVIGGLDFLWQRAEHLRKNRMSRKEMTDEHKDAEGDPHVKQQRRQRGYEIATNKMLADVPGADVIVVNPEHYAVALRWERGKGRAPVCVAKGVDEIAARIREVASENGVPIHRDPPTARALFATVEIGHEIHPEHYAAVAAAIRFAEVMRQTARNGFGRRR